MVKHTPTEVKEKWKRKMKGATEDMRAGAEKVDVAPSKLAIAQKELLKKKLIEAIDSGRWDKQLSKVSLEDWKDAYINTGVSRVASGVEKADAKMEDFMNFLIPAVESAVNEIKTPKTGELEDSIARASEFMRAMSKRKYKG